MNIVIATDFGYVNGGAAKIALGSAKALAARGHHVVVFAGVGPVAPDLQRVPGLSHVCLDQMDVWRDPNRVRAAANSLWNYTAATRMGELLDTLERRDTVLHLHSWTKALSSSVVRAAESRGFKVVMTFHDFLSVCPTGTFFNHGTGDQCHLRPLSAKCMTTNCDSRSYSHKLWRVGRQILQRSIGHLPPADGDFITVSGASDGIVRDLLPRGYHLHHVENFTDVPHGDAVAVERNDAVLFIGRLSAEKGPTLLAEAANRLKVRAVFVGDGDLAGAVRLQCPSAEITGWLSSEQVRDRLRHARALVLPSLWFETQGLVVAEAAAMGVPSIVPDKSGARDWVINGETGLWFQGGNVDDLCRAVDTVMQEPEFAARLGRAAYEKFWSAPSTIDRHAEQLEAVYESILARGTAA